MWGLFNPTDNWGGVANRRFEARNRGLPDAISRLFSNKAVYTVSTTFKNYASYFSPQFLFTSGAGEATYGMIPGRGVLYYVEIPLLISFLILLTKRPGLPNSVSFILILSFGSSGRFIQRTGLSGQSGCHPYPFPIYSHITGTGKFT